MTRQQIPFPGRKSLLLSLLSIILLLALGTVGVRADHKDDETGAKRVLVLGKVSDNPKKHYRYLKPMVDYVVARMQDLGITEGKVLMARDNRQMINYLKQGQVDWVTETPFSAVKFHDKAGAKFLLRKWKKGVPEYHSVIFARKDSGIETLADLRGHTIAFEDRGSTSAFYIPASVLIGAGQTLTQLASARERPPADMVGYVFSGEEINTSAWVHKGLVDAGAFNNLDWEKDDHLPQRLRKDLKIIHRTQSFPRAIELVNPAMDPRLVARLKQILLQAAQDPEARAVLDAYQKTAQFDELDEHALAGLAEARRLGAIVEQHLD